MDRAAYQAQYAQYAAMTERRLEELCDQYLPAQARIAAAARYSLLGGGKRVRAVLALAGCALCGQPAAQAVCTVQNVTMTQGGNANENAENL